MEKVTTPPSYTVTPQEGHEVLTGPMMVACQWNTAKDRNETLKKMLTGSRPDMNATSCSWHPQTYSVNVVIYCYLLSSPTGPAEHWAGGSRARSFSSCQEMSFSQSRVTNVNFSKDWVCEEQPRVNVTPIPPPPPPGWARSAQFLSQW